MAGIGVIALVVGLWLALPPTSVTDRQSAPSAAGWVLVVAAALLIVSSLLGPPVTPSDSTQMPGSDASGAAPTGFLPGAGRSIPALSGPTPVSPGSSQTY